MIDLLNQGCEPTLDEISGYVRNPVFDRFCQDLGASYRIEFSRCSWMPGWNIKFRKGSQSLCTVYPGESVFTVLVVIGAKEREAAEALLPECSRRIQEIYRETQEGNGQRWLMIDLEDRDEVYEDTLRLIELRKNSGKKKKAVDKAGKIC